MAVVGTLGYRPFRRYRNDFRRMVLDDVRVELAQIRRESSPLRFANDATARRLTPDYLFGPYNWRRVAQTRVIDVNKKARRSPPVEERRASLLYPNANAEISSVKWKSHKGDYLDYFNVDSFSEEVEEKDSEGNYLKPEEVALKFRFDINEEMNGTFTLERVTVLCPLTFFPFLMIEYTSLV